jgi:uncharacterized NAD-dependent epimerase/dehydratase family protein
MQLESQIPTFSPPSIASRSGAPVVRPPFALFLGDAPDKLYAKTATGVQRWRAEDCIGQVRLPGCKVDLGLPEMSIATAKTHGVQTLIVGLAIAGGSITEAWKPTLMDALSNGIDIASGMHQRLWHDEDLVALARRHGRSLWDLRSVQFELPVATGRRRIGKRLLTVGTDCGVGKMFAALALTRAMKARGVNVDFRATGQTGILIAGSGICIDAVISDFTAGAAEVLSPDNHSDHWDVIEGQGSLFHPAYAGVTLSLLHGSQPDWLVVCHDAAREMMVGLEGYRVPSLPDCIEANIRAGRLVNANVAVAGICLNTSGLPKKRASAYMVDLEAELGLPVCDPVTSGVDAIVDRLCV